jgi:hypothetical protein
MSHPGQLFPGKLRILSGTLLVCLTSSVGTCAASETVMQRAAFHLRGQSGLKTGTEVEQFNASSGSAKTSLRALLFAALTLLCAVSSLRAEGPILTLAMVNYDFLASSRARAIRDNFVAKVDHHFSLSPQELEPDSILSFFAERFDLPTTTFLEKRPLPEAPNPLLLTLRNNGEDGHPHVWANLSAGYGEVFPYKSVTIYGRNGSCWEEPSCGFLKFSFNF